MSNRPLFHPSQQATSIVEQIGFIIDKFQFSTVQLSSHQHQVSEAQWQGIFKKDRCREGYGLIVCDRAMTPNRIHIEQGASKYL